MSTAAYKKPLPIVDDLNRPYWDGLRQGRLLLARCRDCGHLGSDPPARYCPRCASKDREWMQASGQGEIWGFGHFHQVYFESFRAEVPYTVVLVKLDEGVRLYSNMVGAKREDIKVGRRVTAVFDAVTPELTLLKFKLA